MRKLLQLGAVLALLFCSFPANAATCFWVGGTGNADNANAASWSSSTGGTASTCAATGGIPKNAGDVATFDGSSGGGVVTVCGTSSANCPSGAGVWNIGQITSGAFTGTLDFATRNPNVTLTVAFSSNGSGTRTINLGSGTYTLSAVSGTVFDTTTATGLTLNGGTSVVNASATTTRTAGAIVVGAGITLPNVTVSGNASASFQFCGGTITNVTLVPPVYINQCSTPTAYGSISQSGSPSATAPTIMTTTNFGGGTGTARNLSATGTVNLQYAVVALLTCTGGGTFSFTNSFDAGGNTTCNITGPSAGVPSFIGGGG